ncbi:LysM peptidoglycan-binding domain-containing protein [Bacillus amyloliquefaciens]|uniref:LysM peptidoglycan-binding domain-containing protein n=1 Tax=Bacillus amyloliquefaciens TaxID=1390 RepID=UPI00174E1964|nr:LysM peptidoglycan-binding domain-containing protein [Bacillus amyloliquefaciens]QOE02684.1 LysM peptidoglycan-binding domain-containing protein [Bacillus amyloliquefaciens]
MTEMSRVERRKAQLRAEQQVAAAADEQIEYLEDSLPTRQSVKEERKKKEEQVKEKTKTPLFTFLTVLFIIVTIGVFFGLLYMTNSSRFDPKDYEDVFIDHSESAPAVIPKGAQKETSETALLEQPKKKSDDKDKKEAAASEKTKEKPSEKTSEKTETPSEKQVKPTDTEYAETKQQSPPAVREKAAPAAASDQAGTVPKKVRTVQHTVQPKETLYRISMKYYKSRAGEEKIRSYNGLNGNDVYTGQVLNIPLSD